MAEFGVIHAKLICQAQSTTTINSLQLYVELSFEPRMRIVVTCKLVKAIVQNLAESSKTVVPRG